MRSEAIRFDARWLELYTPPPQQQQAKYRNVPEYLVFGVPDGYVDAGEDQSAILHEYGHALHDALIIGGWIMQMKKVIQEE